MNNNTSIPPIIDVKKLSKSFNDAKAVSDLTLKIYPGSIFGFLGANGSGKTTSLRMLCGLFIPDKGEGKCLGLNLLTQTKAIQAQIGYMPQKFCLYQNLSVYENLDFIARLYSLEKRKKRLDEIMDNFSLKEHQNQITRTLSGGWQQRVALAAALLHKPLLLILDEPTSGIDPQSRIVIWEYLQDLVRNGITILLSTHYMDEAERCNQLAYMSCGKMLVSGSVTEITQQSQLHTWRISGKNLSPLSYLLKKNQGDIVIIEKGNEIRISSLQHNILEKIDPSLLINYTVNKTDTTMEDVFIYKIKHEGKFA